MSTALVLAHTQPEQTGAALREVGKLERASEQNPEAGWIRTTSSAAHRAARMPSATW